MAASRAKTQPVGSIGWIQNEQEQADQSVEQEAEDFGYSVRNELEWLNEHMAEIFSKNQVNFADVFKTPGKLRGKTPRTARKQNALGARQPLTDIFAPNVPAPASAQKTSIFDKVAHFEIAEDAENQPPPAQRPHSRSKSPQRVNKNINTDSGYHGMTDDEVDVDNRTEAATTSSQQSCVQKVPLREDQPPPQRVTEGTAEPGAGSEDSFMSAKENLTSQNVSKEQLRQEQDRENSTVVDDVMEIEQQPAPEDDTTPPEHAANDEPADDDQELEAAESRSQSDASSPDKPLQRKSSFNFTALPARETLTAKKSFGGRNSQVDRNSTLGRSFGTKSFGIPQNEEDEFVEDKSEESKAYNKTSTQLLHEKISMLGKMKEPRPSKSLHQQFAYPQLPAAVESSKTAAPADDSDDDWIAPSKPGQGDPVKPDQEQLQAKEASPERPRMHQKSISTTQIPSPSRAEPTVDSRHLKAVSVSNPNLAHASGAIQSITPAGSPMAKKHHDGPLSASKSKLYSVLKSAKSIFASSASASAAAKLEAHSNSPSRTPAKPPKRDFSDESKTAAVFNMPGALYSERQLPQQSPGRAMSVLSKTSASPSRKTRSSNESDKKKDKEMKAQQKAADELEKAREKERQKAAKQQEEKQKAEDADAETARKEKEAQNQQQAQAGHLGMAGSDGDMPPPPPPKTMLPGKLRAPGRLVKPTGQAPQPARPAPVSIRVASHSQRLHQAPSSSSFSKSQIDSAAPPPPPKGPVTRPGSALGSMRGSKAPDNRSVKALEAAARKKEADDKNAQRKADQKRELERKRAAKAEDERRAEEERKAVEAQRLQEAKVTAQRQAEKQALESRRRELQRLEQQRQQEEAQKAKAAHELAEAIKRERAQQPPAHPRGDVGGTMRQISKNTVPEPALSRPVTQHNPAKPAKRVWEDDESTHHQPQQPQRPGMQRGPQSFQQIDAKRRRTNEDEQPEERPSVMAPPKRPSNMRKESTLAKFPHGYTHAPPPAVHNQSMFKATVTAQAHKTGMPVHPSQLAQVSNARIPFAENANPPGAPHHHHGHMPTYPGHENIQPGAQQNKFKTPSRPAQAPKSAKSSPLFPNGDNIELPDIATDSEDEDSEDDDNTGFRAPSWVASPALRDLLTQQQLVDPETVFGPIGELKMEEVFRNGKNQERLKKFRDRTSSALWAQNGDAVTSAEKRRDMEMRERVVREGGWRYEPNQ